MTTHVKFLIEDGCYAYDLPKTAINKIKKDLSFANPEYVNAVKEGRFIPADLAPTLYFFEMENDKAWFPRGYIPFLKQFLEAKNIKVIIKDKSTKLKLNVKFKGKLRDYQNDTVTRLTSYPVGMIEALTGSGKSAIALGVIAKLKQTTLILVHSKELLYQWQKAIHKFLGVECGLLGDGKTDIKPITVGIINTVEKHIIKVKNQFGILIVDEGHRSASKRWRNTIVQFTAKYHYLLSATPFRSDGLTKVLHVLFGKKVKVNADALRQQGYVLTPTIYKVETNFTYNFTNDYTKMISRLCEDHSRNKLIAEVAFTDFNHNKQPIIIISDRKKHLQLIQNELNMYSQILTGTTPNKERQNIVDQVKHNECDVLLSTAQLISEGADFPNLSAMLLTTPIRNKKKLIQSIGRIVRPSKGANPRVYDFRDNYVNVLKYSGFARDKIYRTEWRQ